MNANAGAILRQTDDVDDLHGVRLSQTVVRHILARVISGELRQGEFVRTKTIAAALNCSLTPIREALFQLQSDGLVRLAPRRGFIVAGFDRAYVADTFFVEAIIGGEVAARAAQNITKAELEHLAEIQTACEGAIAGEDEDLAARRVGDFHQTINSAAKSPRLVSLMKSLSERLPNFLSVRPGDRLNGEVAAQRIVLRALMDRSPDAARSAMRDHIIANGERLAAALEKKGLFAQRSP